MKVAILAGGKGTRLSEETQTKPKPMVMVGDLPLLCHIMSIYAGHGFNEFVVALGYKGEVIREYFYRHIFPWSVELLETGDETLTGGRVKRLAQHIGREPFMLTYGDGLGNVNINALLNFHREQNSLVTLTAVRPPARFGHLVIEGSRVTQFNEKPQASEGWINGGFFVLEPGITDYIEGDQTWWEFDSMERLAADGHVRAYRHEGFWQCVDTTRDMDVLNKLWQAGSTPWLTHSG
jgi:glucose-1-phosphate cytidylyltransferase